MPSRTLPLFSGGEWKWICDLDREFFRSLPDAGFCVWRDMAFPSAHNNTGFQRARGPPPETKGAFGRGETVCAAHLPFLLPQMIVACFFGPYYVSGSRIKPESQVGWREGYCDSR